MPILALVLIALGLAVLAFGKRLMILGAGIGLLLGVGIIQWLNIPQENLLWWLLLPVGLAVVFAFGTRMLGGVISLVMTVIGALGGAAIALALPELFGFLQLGISEWILALAGGVVGMLVIGRFKDWGPIVIASIVGAMLTVRGLYILIPSLQGTYSSLLTLVLAAVGIAYNAGWIGKSKPEAAPAQAAAAPPPAAPPPTVATTPTAAAPSTVTPPPANTPPPPPTQP